MKIKLGILFGGNTVEHEISIISAVQAMEQLNKEKYDIIPIYISKNHVWYSGDMLKDISVYKDFEDLKKYASKVTLYNKNDKVLLQTTGFFKRIISDIDLLFPIVHGNNVEDGSIQGFCQTLGIPFVGSNVLSSAIGQDKVIMKQIMNSVGLPIVDYTWFYDYEYLSNRSDILSKIKKVGYPVIVKPATLGSSIGIKLAKNEEEVISAINEALKYDSKIIVEEAIENLIEVNCSVLGNKEFQETSVIEEVIHNNDILTYEDKYVGGSKKFGAKTASKGMASADRIIPANISDKLIKEVEELSKKVFYTLNFSGLVRIDYLIDSKKKKVYINEPNTIPGSLSFYLWEPKGKKYTDLLDDMINISIKEFKNKNKKVCSFDVNILSNFNGLKGFKGIKKSR